MRIRSMTRDDIPSIATVCSEAFWDDDLWSWRHPYKSQYPEDFRACNVRLFKMSLCQPDCRVLVAETDQTDPDWQGSNVVVGCAIWERWGSSDVAKSWVQDSLFRKIERRLLDLEERYISTFGLDRSVSSARTKIMKSPTEAIFGDVGESWHLAFLCVSPRFQRRGIGGLLIDWGLDKAAREGVPAVLEASPVGESLYLKKGFRTYGYHTWAPGFVGPALLWEPEDQKGKWGTSRTIDMF
ncbi:MAG: hypothetical protein M1816_005979 [Peltula sp. TS41687]|nr:MAG: hypothetical protein M1816_005979 [Peltula sp. TS41687]